MTTTPNTTEQGDDDPDRRQQAVPVTTHQRMLEKMGGKMPTRKELREKKWKR